MSTLTPTMKGHSKPVADATEPGDITAPNSVEGEVALLGSAIIAPDEISGLLAIVSTDDFFLVKHSWIWQALVDLHNSEQEVDNVTLVGKLRERGQLEDIGGSAYITGLINDTPTYEHATTYAEIVKRASMRRKLLAAAGRLAESAVNESADIDTILVNAQRTIEAVAALRTQNNIVSGVEVLQSATDEFAEWGLNPVPEGEVRTTLYSGIPKLDELAGGFNSERPYVFEGATGMGKSSMGAFIAGNFMLQAPGLVMPTERTLNQWIHRAVADLMGIDILTLESGRLSQEQSTEAESIYDRFYVNARNLWLLDSSAPNPYEIYDATKRLIRDQGIKWAYIDSLNNVAGKSNDEIYQKTSAAAEMALSLARDLGLVVLMTAQTGRNIKGRTNFMPQLNDGQGSHKIEEVSERVFGLYRHDYYIQRGMATPESRYNKKSGKLIYPEGGTVIVDLKVSGKWLHVCKTAGGFTHCPPGQQVAAPTAPPIKYFGEKEDED